MTEIINKSWYVYLEDDGWYYYTWTNDGYGPFETEEGAWNALDCVVQAYERGE